MDLPDLGHTINQSCHLIAETALYIIQCDMGIFNGIMEKCGDNAIHIQTQTGKNICHGQRVGHVEIA